MPLPIFPTAEPHGSARRPRVPRTSDRPAAPRAVAAPTPAVAKDTSAPRAARRRVPRRPETTGAPLPVARRAAESELETLCRMARALVPSTGRDLTLRQLAVLMVVHDGAAPRTACALADLLSIPRPAMTRALDRLSALNLTRRAADPACRRNILVHPTTRGRSFLGGLRQRLSEGGDPRA
jgi:DNA-binding MarR family transcriptional regulator